MLSWNILQYFWHALRDNRSWKPILVFSLSGPLRQYGQFYRNYIIMVIFLYILCKIPWSPKMTMLYPNLCYNEVYYKRTVLYAIRDLSHCWVSTLYLIETPFNTFANKADPDQAALVRAAWSGSTLVCLWKNIIRYDPTLVDLTSHFFVLCTNVKVYLYNYS